MNSLKRIKDFVDELTYADNEFDTYRYFKELTAQLSSPSCICVSNLGEKELFINSFDLTDAENGLDPIELQNNREEKLVIDHINGAPTTTRWLLINTKDDETGEKQNEIFRLFQIAQRHLKVTIQIYRPSSRWVIVGFEANLPLNVLRSDLIPLTQLMVYRLQHVLSETTINMADDQKLTPRELDCLRWFAEGKTSQEIAIILGISSRTVNMHANSIIVKLNASNRINAVAKAIRHGLI